MWYNISVYVLIHMLDKYRNLTKYRAMSIDCNMQTIQCSITENKYIGLQSYNSSVNTLLKDTFVNLL